MGKMQNIRYFTIFIYNLSTSLSLCDLTVEATSSLKVSNSCHDALRCVDVRLFCGMTRVPHTSQERWVKIGSTRKPMCYLLLELVSVTLAFPEGSKALCNEIVLPYHIFPLKIQDFRLLGFLNSCLLAGTKMLFDPK